MKLIQLDEDAKKPSTYSMAFDYSNDIINLEIVRLLKVVVDQAKIRREPLII
jgi:hypothetical protein